MPPPSGEADWVVMGFPLGLFARTDPAKAVFVLASEGDVSASLAAGVTPAQERGEEPVEVTLQLRGYLVVEGVDYGDALRRLFEHWQPGSPPAVGPGALRLSRGPDRLEGGR